MKTKEKKKRSKNQMHRTKYGAEQFNSVYGSGQISYLVPFRRIAIPLVIATLI